MHIVAVTVPGGPRVATFTIGHGEDPLALLWRAGWTLVRWLSAGLRPASDEVLLTCQVLPKNELSPEPPTRFRGRDTGLSTHETITPLIKQRVACYAITLSDRGLLATRFSRRTAVPDTWGLPGGGREPRETPADTVRRELAEETGQSIVIERLIDVQSDHWIGRSPTEEIEDFHALRIIYVAHVHDPSDPVVHDVGGTTAQAMWVPLPRWRSLPWSLASRTLLDRHLPTLTA